MPHVDDGTLHALLDGALRAMEPGEADAVEAHLEACAECRARLEEAAALRGRAGEVLAVLEPAVAPDFEEVLVRAGAAAGGARSDRRLARQARWTRGVAWAATIVIALGTGYLIRDRLVPERASQARPVEVSAPEQQNGSAADGAMGAGGGAADVEDVEVTESARGDEDVQVGNAEPASGGATVPRPATPLAAPAEDQAAAGDRTVRAAPTAAQADPAPEPRLEPVGGTLTAPAVALEDLRVTGLRREGEEEAAVAGAERTITPEEAAELLGAPLLILPRAELVRAEAAVAADVPTVTSVQRLGEGTLVRVTQRPLGAEAPLGHPTSESTRGAAAPAAAQTDPRPRSRMAQPRLEAAMPLADTDTAVMNTVRVDVSGSELVVEGPLPAAALEVLAASATPYVARR